MGSSDDTETELAALRAEVDEIDQQIMLLLGVRFRCTDMIAELKQTGGLDPFDQERAQQQLDRIRDVAIDAGVPPDLAVTILRAIIDVVVADHRQQRDRPYS